MTEIVDRTKEWTAFSNPLINLKRELKLTSDGCVIIKHPVEEKMIPLSKIPAIFGEFIAADNFQLSSAITKELKKEFNEWFDKTYPI